MSYKTSIKWKMKYKNTFEENQNNLNQGQIHLNNNHIVLKKMNYLHHLNNNSNLKSLIFRSVQFTTCLPIGSSSSNLLWSRIPKTQSITNLVNQIIILLMNKSTSLPVIKFITIFSKMKVDKQILITQTFQKTV